MNSHAVSTAYKQIERAHAEGKTVVIMTASESLSVGSLSVGPDDPIFLDQVGILVGVRWATERMTPKKEGVNWTFCPWHTVSTVRFCTNAASSDKP